MALQGQQGGGAAVVQGGGPPLLRQGAVVVGQGFLEPPKPAEQHRPVVERVQEIRRHRQGFRIGLEGLVGPAEIAQAIGQVAVGGRIGGIERDRARQALHARLQLAGLQGDQPDHMVADGVVRVRAQHRVEGVPRLLHPSLLQRLEAGLQERLRGRRRAVDHGPVLKPGLRAAKLKPRSGLRNPLEAIEQGRRPVPERKR